MDFKKIKKSELIKMYKKLQEEQKQECKCNQEEIYNIEDKEQNMENELTIMNLREENIKLLNQISKFDDKIQNLISNKNDDYILYLQKRISETNDKKKNKYIKILKNYL